MMTVKLWYLVITYWYSDGHKNTATLAPLDMWGRVTVVFDYKFTKADH